MDVSTLDLKSMAIGSGVVAEQAWILDGPIVLIGTVAGACGHHRESRFDVHKGIHGATCRSAAVVGLVEGLIAVRYSARVTHRAGSDHLDARQLAHASVEGSGELATLPSMLGDDQAVGESAGVRFEQG